MSKILSGFLILAFAFIFSSCNSVSTNNVAEKIVDKFWNKIDAEHSADSLVSKFISAKYISEFSNKSKPKIVVGKFDNLTNENINMELIEKNVERSLLNSGRISFVSDKSLREEVRHNRMNAEAFKSTKEFRKYLSDLNSDLFIGGRIELTSDSLSSSSKKEYKIAMQVLNIKNMKIIFDENTKVFK